LEKLKLKIRDVGEIEREPESTKSLKSIEEYQSEPLSVLFVPFGGHIKGRDSDGEAFHEDTDIVLQPGDTRPITYYHGFGADDPTKMQNKPAIIGRLVYTHRDDQGHWGDAFLDSDEELAKRIINAIAENRDVKASSGAVSHLVRYAEGGLINDWAVGEVALFDTNEWRRPANELAIVRKKSTNEAKADEPQDANSVGETEPVSEQEAEAEAVLESAIITKNKKHEEYKMETEIEEVEQVEKVVPEIDYEKLAKAMKDVFPAEAKGAPAHLKMGLGEKDELKAFTHFVKTGQENSVMASMKGSNDTDMNITTDVDGQYLVPTGFYQQVITRKDEMALAGKLGVTEIPGVGTTVDVPYDNEADGEFVHTTEAAEFDDDAPATGKKSLTFKKYSKIIRISHELLRDEDAKLLAFLSNFVGRGMAKTHNDLLITEVESYGTSLKTFASATAVAVGELEAMVFQADMVSYLEGGSPAWVMSGPSYSKIASLVGDARSYVSTPQGTGVQAPGILGYPVSFTNKADTIAASKKSVFFGDWSAVGVRNGAGLQMIRDPYTRARYGQIELVFLFDAVYGVLNAEAIGYGVHPSA